MASCFTETGRLRLGSKGTPITGGRKAIAEYFRGIVDRARTQSHFITNHQLLFDQPDRAVGECNMYSWQIWNSGDVKTTYCFGRYEYCAIRESDGRGGLIR